MGPTRSVPPTEPLSRMHRRKQAQATTQHRTYHTTACDGRAVYWQRRRPAPPCLPERRSENYESEHGQCQAHPRHYAARALAVTATH